MPSLKLLRRRVRSVKNTQLITRAMRSVAATKMRRTQDRRNKARPYVERLQQLVSRVLSSVTETKQPLMETRDSSRTLLVIMASDRGLCGAFNNTVLRYASNLLKQMPEDTGVVAIGKRSSDFFRKNGIECESKHIDFNGNVELPRVLEISAELQNLFLSGKYDRVELVYNRAITAMTYKPTREVFLPLRTEELRSGDEPDNAGTNQTEYIFEPDPQTLLTDLLPKFVETKILFTFVDAFAAEHQARMMAMSAANDNCKELIESLTLDLNKARQTSITTEILEIVSGAEALNA